MHTRFSLEDLRERGHLIDAGVGGSRILNWDVGAWTGSIWNRIGKGGGLL
jgi:hypothetical protein